jgi:serine protease inhibitor ecotin
MSNKEMICKCICGCKLKARTLSGAERWYYTVDKSLKPVGSLCGVCGYEVTYAPKHAEGRHGEKA